MVVNLIIFYLKTGSCNWRSEDEGLFTNTSVLTKGITHNKKVSCFFDQFNSVSKSLQ